MIACSLTPVVVFMTSETHARHTNAGGMVYLSRLPTNDLDHNLRPTGGGTKSEAPKRTDDFQNAGQFQLVYSSLCRLLPTADLETTHTTATRHRQERSGIHERQRLPESPRGKAALCRNTRQLGAARCQHRPACQRRGCGGHHNFMQRG